MYRRAKSLASRFHPERTENYLESTLRTYSDFFLFQSVGFFFPYAPRATNQRSIISLAKANQEEPKWNFLLHGGTGARGDSLPS